MALAEGPGPVSIVTGERGYRGGGGGGGVGRYAAGGALRPISSSNSPPHPQAACGTEGRHGLPREVRAGTGAWLVISTSTHTHTHTHTNSSSSVDLIHRVRF